MPFMMPSSAPRVAASAVRVVSAIHCIQQGLLEISLTVEQSQHHEGHVGRSLEPAEVGAVLHHQLARFLPRNACFEGFDDDFDAAGYAAVGGDLGKTDPQQRICILNHKGGAFHRGDKDGGVSAFAKAVIHAGILIGEANCLFYHGGVEAGPNLGADPGAVGMLPFFVVDFAGEGRQQPVAHVRFADAVFVPVRRHPADPVFAQRLGVDALRDPIHPQARSQAS